MELIHINNVKTLYMLCTTFLIINISACNQPLTEKESPKKAVQEEVYQEEIKTLKEDMKNLKEDMQVLKENMQISKEDIKIPQTNTQTPKEEIQILKEDFLDTISDDILSEAGQKILTIGNKMAVETKEIVEGSCWDYINTIYNRAGYPVQQRVTVYKSNKDEEPYADADTIQAGDWLYYINHSYHGVEHSGIFVNWVDESKKIANILSYGGENRKEAGRYRNYDLSNVYTIIRAKNKVQIPKQE